MVRQVTHSTIEKKLKKEINALSRDDLGRLDEEGACIYLLTDSKKQPFLYISFGSPFENIYHEWADQRNTPKAREDMECWQEERTPPESLRQSLHDYLPSTLIDAYLTDVEYSNS
jgi:hypothetical protein